MATRQTRSGRSSRGTAARTQFQADLQTQRRQKQLENLEKDNYGEEENQNSAEESASDDVDPFSSGKAKKRKSARKNRPVRSVQKNRKTATTFQHILDIENYGAYETHIPTYLTAAAAPSVFPPRHFCANTGFMAAYTHPATGQRYYSSREYEMLQQKINPLM